MSDKTDSDDSKKGKKPKNDTIKDSAKVKGNKDEKSSPKKTEGKEAKEEKKIIKDPRDEEFAQELEEYNDRYMRLAAEFDNFKKRSANELKNVIITANKNLIFELLGILDNLERALTASDGKKDFDSLHEGIELVYKQFSGLLNGKGLEKIKAVGEVFDPNYHEAISQGDDKEKDSDIILQEIEKGYKLNDIVIRASKVIVNK